MTDSPQPAHLAGIDVAGDRVRFDLLTSDGVTCVTMPLDAAHHQALRAVLALYTHSHGCPGHVDVHVGLLLGVVAALDGGRPQLVVHRDTDQPIRLRLHDRESVELALGALDACSLLCSQRLPTVVDPPCR